MDSIGLLAAWVGVISFLLTIVTVGAAHVLTPQLQRWRTATSPMRAQKRIQELYSDLAVAERPDIGYVADLVALYGRMVLNLVAAGTMVIVSIEMLDLGPAILASTLPFSINAKLLSRFTGLFLLGMTYVFVFRLSALAVRIRRKTLPRKPDFAQRALGEIASLRQMHGLEPQPPVMEEARQ